MITAWDIYWVSMLDSFGRGAFVCFIAFGLLAWLFIYVGCEEESKPLQISGFCCVFFAFLMLAICMFIPTTKTAVAMYAVPKIANNQEIQQIPPNFAKLINKKLQEWMEDVDIIPKEEK